MDFRSEFILIPNTPFGDLQVRYYGIIVVTAMLVAAFVASRLARRRGLDPDHVWGGLTWAIFPGIIGARLWFVFFPPISLTMGCGTERGLCMDTAWFLQNFFNLENGAIAIWSGGLSIFGAVLGGMLGAWLYIGPWHNRIARFFHNITLPISAIFATIGWIFGALLARIQGKEAAPYTLPAFESDFPDEGYAISPWLDIAGIALPLAQAIGRFANYVNQELYGLPTGVSWWGIPIDGNNRVGEYADRITYPVAGDNVTLFHPLFLYEAIWNIAAFFVLRWLFLKRRASFLDGDFFLLYVAQYSVIRFLLEFVRVEVAFIPGTQFNSSQVFTIIVFVLAVSYFLYRRRGGVEQNENKAVSGAS